MLDQIGRILRHYQNDYGIDLNSKDAPPIRTRFLRKYLEEMGVVDRINIFEADVHTDFIVAQVKKYVGEVGLYSGMLDCADIFYAANHNFCWRRFGVCKEMYHCVIDRTKEDRVATIDSLRTLIELLSADTTAVTGEFAPFTREQEAEILALETLFPVEFRQDYLDEAPGEEVYKALANQFKVPLEYARLACQPVYVRTITQKRGRLVDGLA